MTLFSFGMPVLWMFHLSFTLVGLCLYLDIQLAVTIPSHQWMIKSQNENLLGNSVNKECSEDGNVYKVEKQFLSPLPNSQGNSVIVHYSVQFVHKPYTGTLVFVT